MYNKLALSFADAKAIAEAAGKYAFDNALRVTIAVCDEGGHLLVVHRHDDASPASARIAVSKCLASALTRRETRFFQALINEKNAAFATMPIEGLVEGGMPLVVNGQLVGAVGVSGASSAEDADIARAGAAMLPKSS